ncbi:hypothetical protein K3495_g16580, partial [Podosphaera aphanis]
MELQMRTAGRILQLLPNVQLFKVNVQDKEPDRAHVESENRPITSKENLIVDPATRSGIFDDDELQALWKQGVEHDKDWQRARDAVQSG